MDRNTYFFLLRTWLLSCFLVPDGGGHNTDLWWPKTELHFPKYIRFYFWRHGAWLHRSQTNGMQQPESQRLICVTHLEKRSARVLFLPRPLSDSSFAVTRKDCVAHDCRLNGPLSISASYWGIWRGNMRNDTLTTHQLLQNNPKKKDPVRLLELRILISLRVDKCS